MAVSSDKQQQQKDQPKPPFQVHDKEKEAHKVPIPNKQPTPRIKKSRLKKAIGESYKNSFFWKVFEPEKIAPPNSSDDLPPEIAYVTTLTKCGGHRGSIDGAAVLLHSIRRNSYGWIPMQSQSLPWILIIIVAKVWRKRWKYRYKAYVIVDPQASPTIKDKHGDCARFMQSIGWTVLHRPPLVPLFEIPTAEASSGHSSASFDELVKAGYIARRPGEHPNKLRMLMYNDGCCGDTELLKLHTYGLVGHELAVHLDFDSLILRPMDDLFDVMLGKQKDDKVVESLSIAKLHNQNQLTSLVLLMRPSRETTTQSNHHHPRMGKQAGGFYGDATFQGIVPYYYEDVAPPGEHNELELDRCIYNQMADNPRKSTHKFPRPPHWILKSWDTAIRISVAMGGKIDSITTHFTFCNKPWDCSSGLPGTVALDTCLGLLSEWYGVRRELEDWWLLPRNEAGEATNDVSFSQRSFYWNQRTIDRVQQKRQGSLQPDVYKGYCDGIGESGYRNMMGPDGLKK
ncbi:glycosyltransferase family protein [Skeletonema marinoi]|uniref:Glycosyltransferase family protein n=1 Tax=Skeletonema marinoi TaxID=267567 RepID=A0AAD9DJT1_9STRA|nr:glycosyltransferase family protein [Skeletonema marinoi]